MVISFFCITNHGRPTPTLRRQHIENFLAIKVSGTKFSPVNIIMCTYNWVLGLMFKGKFQCATPELSELSLNCRESYKYFKRAYYHYYINFEYV